MEFQQEPSTKKKKKKERKKKRKERGDRPPGIYFISIFLFHTFNYLLKKSISKQVTFIECLLCARLSVGLKPVT